jgi:hypothetical protein
MKQVKMVLGFLSTSLAANISESVKDPKHWGPGAALAALGLGTEAWLLKKLRDCKGMKLTTVVGNSLQHFVMSVVVGGLAGGAAYLSDLSDEDQAVFIGLVVAALNLTIADIRVLFRASQDRPVTEVFLDKDRYFAINDSMPDSKMGSQDAQFAKSIQKSILLKLPFLYIAGVVIYEVTPVIKDKTSADDNYFTDHPREMAVAVPIALHRIWSAVTPYVVKPAPQPLPTTFAFQ